jgi:hypothetical protein
MITANGRKSILSREQRFSLTSTIADRSQAYAPRSPEVLPVDAFSERSGSIVNGFFIVERVSSIVWQQSRKEVMPAQLMLYANYNQSFCGASSIYCYF